MGLTMVSNQKAAPHGRERLKNSRPTGAAKIGHDTQQNVCLCSSCVQQPALRLKRTGKRRFYFDKKSHWLSTAVVNQCDEKFAPFAASSGRLFSDSPFDALELKPSRSRDVCSDESARGAYLHQPLQVERVMKVRLSCSAVEACLLFRLASLRINFIEKVKI